jgi:hypothetical protein
MAKCGAGECECECTNGCGCIASSDEPANCECRCFGGLRPPNFGVFEGTSEINLTLRGAPASHVAVALSRALRVELAVPTSLLDKRLNVRLKNTPIRTVIKHRGFVKIRGASANSPKQTQTFALKLSV